MLSRHKSTTFTPAAQPSCFDTIHTHQKLIDPAFATQKSRHRLQATKDNQRQDSHGFSKSKIKHQSPVHITFQESHSYRRNDIDLVAFICRLPHHDCNHRLSVIDPIALTAHITHQHPPTESCWPIQHYDHQPHNQRYRTNDDTQKTLERIKRRNKEQLFTQTTTTITVQTRFSPEL